MFEQELNDMAVCDAAEILFDLTIAVFPFGGQTPEQNRSCFGVSGLVYLCRANTNNCEPFLGNGDKTTPDGFLYKRNRKSPILA